VLLLVPVVTSAWGSGDGGGHRAGGGALAELRATTAGGLNFELRTARSLGRSQPLATVTVGPSLPADQTEALRFNPWTTGPGIHSAGWLNLLRDAAYRASQRGRMRANRPGSIAHSKFVGPKASETRCPAARQRSVAADR